MKRILWPILEPSRPPGAHFGRLLELILDASWPPRGPWDPCLDDIRSLILIFLPRGVSSGPPGSVLGRLGGAERASWRVLGAFWGVSGVSWGRLEASWDVLAASDAEICKS